MTNEELREKALASLIGRDEETEKFYCGVCNRLFKMRGHVVNHLEKVHSDKVSQAAVKIKADSILREIEWVHQYIFESTDKEIRRESDKLNEAKDCLNRDVASFSERYLKSAVIAEARINLVKEIKSILEYRDADIFQIRDELKNLSAEWRRAAINDLPTHNSTNEMSNIVDRWKFEARVEMIRDRSFSRGFLVETLKGIRHLITLSENLHGLELIDADIHS
jgi:hypothetical protein